MYQYKNCLSLNTYSENFVDALGSFYIKCYFVFSATLKLHFRFTDYETVSHERYLRNKPILTSIRMKNVSLHWVTLKRFNLILELKSQNENCPSHAFIVLVTIPRNSFLDIQSISHLTLGGAETNY